MRAILLILPALALLTRTHAHLGSCEDHFFECPTWQYFGRCDTHLEFMAKNCPHSCNVCVDPGCFDRNHLCGAWTQQGFCRTSRQVQAACPHSCDICQLPESILPKTITKPDFDCGRPASSSFIRGKRQIIFPGEPGYFVSQREQQIGRLTVPAPIGIEGKTPLRISVNDAFCGATIIHERFLITAAHCVFSQERPPIMVRVGELDFSSDNEARSRPADYRVKRVIVHPKFKRNSLERYNDIAIIETVDKMQFNDVVFPLCLSDRRPSVGSIATGSGFGLVNQTHRSTHAQEADLRILDSRLCEARYASEGLGDTIRHQYPRFIQTSDIICAAFPGTDACQGDSGGPLYQDANGRRYLVGVISQGIPCSGQSYTLPGFYVSVADHINFINNVIYPS